MNEDGLKIITTRFEGRGNINVSIERCIDTNDTEAPVACRIHVDHPNDNGMGVSDDTIWLDDISDLAVLNDAISSFIDMSEAEERRKGGDHGTV